MSIPVMKTFLIGFGRMGQRHYQVLKSIGLTNIVIFDQNTDHSEIGICPHNTFEEQLTLQRPDLVIISSTAPSHAEYIHLAIHAGVKYILCEKPVCVSLSEAKTLEETLKKYPQTKIAVNHQMRFMEQYTRIKQMINEEGFGQLGSIAVQGGNFGAAMNGTHYFEMFRFLTDQYAIKTWSWLKPQGDTNPRGDRFQDVAGSIRLENKLGQRFYMDISEDQGHGIFVTYTCKYGQIHVDELMGRVYISKRKNRDDILLPTTRYGMPSGCYDFKIEPADAIEPTTRVLKSLLEEENFPSLSDGVMAIKTLVAAYASSELLGKVVEIDDISAEYKNKIFPWA
jgi:predicted dehydrogenase